MPTDTKSEDKIKQLQEYQEELESAIEVIDSIVKDGGVNKAGLDLAISTIENVLDKDRYGELYKKLKLGYISQTREATRNILSIEDTELIEREILKDRDKIKRILRKINIEFRGLKTKEPTKPEPIAKPKPHLPKSHEDLQVEAGKLLDNADLSGALKLIADYFKSLKISDKDIIRGFQKDTAIGMLNNPPDVDEVRRFLATLTTKITPPPPQAPPDEKATAEPKAIKEPKSTKAKPRTKEIGFDEIYESIDKTADGTADRLAMTIRIITRIKMGAKNMNKDFYEDRNKYFDIDNSLPIWEQLDISNQIMQAIRHANNSFLGAVFSSQADFDNKKILIAILKVNGNPKTPEEAKKKVEEALKQIQEIIKKAKSEVKKPTKEPTSQPTDKPTADKRKKTKSIEMPNSMPEILRNEAMEAIKEDGQKKRFILAWRIYKGDISLLDQKDRKIIKSKFDALIKIEAKTEEEKEIIHDEINEILNIIPSADPLKDREHEEKFKIFLDEICIFDEGLETKVKTLFEILRLNSKDFTEPAYQNLVEELQFEIRHVLFVSNVPNAIGISKDSSPEERMNFISKMRLPEKIKKAKEIKQSIDEDPELTSMLDIYERKVKKAERKTAGKQVPIIEAEPVFLTESDKTKTDEVSLPDTSDTAKKTTSSSGTTEKKEEIKKRETKEKGSEIPDDKIEKFMSEILREGDKYIVKGKLKNPACLAIQKLIKEEIGIYGINDLKNFLQKPKIKLTEEAKKYREENTIKKLESLIKEQQYTIDDLVQRAKKAKLSDEEVKTILEEKRKETNKKEHMELALSSMKEKIQYKTPLHVLAMINFYLEKGDKEEVSSYLDVNILKKTEEQIQEQRESISDSFSRKAINFVTFGLIKPSLKNILETLGTKENILKKIGKEKMHELANLKEESDVKEWLRNLDGGKEHAYNEVLPLLIAYLEMAIRGGRMSYINTVSMGSAEKLLKHLRAVRIDHYANEIEGENGSEIDLMNKYFGKMNKSILTEQEVSKKIISDPTYWRLAFGAISGAAVGLTGGLALAGFATAGLGAGFGTLTAGGAVRSLGKDLDPESKKSVRRGVVRSLVAGTLATGAAFLGAGLAAPLLALPGLFSPELFKYRKQIKDKTVKGTKIVAPKAGKAAIFSLKTIPKFILVPLSLYGIFTQKGRERLSKIIKW